MRRWRRKRKRQLERQLQQQRKHLKAKLKIGRELGALAPVTPTERTEKVARLIAVKTLGRPSVLKTLPLNILFFLFLGTTVVSSSAVVSSSDGSVVASPPVSLRIARQLPLLMSAQSTSRKPTASPTPVTSASGRASTVKPSTTAVEMSLHATVSAIR